MPVISGGPSSQAPNSSQFASRSSQSEGAASQVPGALLAAACRKTLVSARAPSHIRSAAAAAASDSPKRRQSRKSAPRASKIRAISGTKSVACCLLQNAKPSATPASVPRPDSAKNKESADQKSRLISVKALGPKANRYGETAASKPAIGAARPTPETR